MNYTETFDQFASKLGPTDLALYAGAAIVLWVLFKDRLSPVQQVVLTVTNKLKSLFGGVTLPTVTKSSSNQDIFFELVKSWKQTRDLAEKSGCIEAVKSADQMFPFLSPTVCTKENSK